MFVIPSLFIPSIFSIPISFSFVFVTFISCPSTVSFFRLKLLLAIIPISFVSPFPTFISSGFVFISICPICVNVFLPILSPIPS